MRSYKLAVLVILILPGLLFGADPFVVLNLSGAKPGTYYYAVVVSPNGTVTLELITNIVRVGDPGIPLPQPVPPIPVPNPPNPSPQPQPDLTVEQKVQQLTQDSVSNGGSITTAVGLQRTYNIIAGSLEVNQISKDNTFKAIEAATDVVLSQAGMSEIWSRWRTEVSNIIASLQASGNLNTKEQLSSLLRRIENGIKNAVNTLSVSDPKLQDKIDYDSVLKIQQKVIDTVSKSKG